MKRVAESQLTKDGAEDEDESQEVATGFQKADPSSLSQRKIRGLPKRVSAAHTPPATSPSPSNGMTEQSSQPASPFGAFTGFGGSPSAFTFSVPPSQATSSLSQPLSATTGASSPLEMMPSPSKGFTFSPAISNSTPPSTPHSTSDLQRKRDAAHKYYLSLRGLNSSFLDAVTQAVQADPFVDIAEMLEKYKSLRFTAQKEFDTNSPIGTSGQARSVVAPPMAPSSSRFTPHMSVAPKFIFVSGGDTLAAGSLGYQEKGFTSKEVRQTDESPSPSPGKTAVTTSGMSDKSALHATSQPLISDNVKPPANHTFPFGTDKHDIGPADPTTSTSEKPLEEKETFQGKSSNPFAFSFKPAAAAAPLTPGFSSFMSAAKSSSITGETSTPPSAKPNPLNPSPPSPSGFGFGTGKNISGTSAFGLFGKGSIGNPVGFAFGSPPTTPSAAIPSDPAAVTASDASLEVGASGGVDGASSIPSHDPSPAPSQGSAYDADGPGEEEEVTLHETRAKAYKMTSTGDTKGWVQVGSGQLKLKGRVELAKRRILMRNSSSGQIILNFNLFPGFKVTAERKTISFRVPGEDEAAAVYQVKVPNETEAITWQETVQKEVDGLLPSHDT